MFQTASRAEKQAAMTQTCSRAVKFISLLRSRPPTYAALAENVEDVVSTQALKPRAKPIKASLSVDAGRYVDAHPSHVTQATSSLV